MVKKEEQAQMQILHHGNSENGYSLLQTLLGILCVLLVLTSAVITFHSVMHSVSLQCEKALGNISYENEKIISQLK